MGDKFKQPNPGSIWQLLLGPASGLGSDDYTDTMNRYTKNTNYLSKKSDMMSPVNKRAFNNQWSELIKEQDQLEKDHKDMQMRSLHNTTIKGEMIPMMSHPAIQAASDEYGYHIPTAFDNLYPQYKGKF
jgi:hypothetical protein